MVVIFVITTLNTTQKVCLLCIKLILSYIRVSEFLEIVHIKGIEADTNKVKAIIITSTLQNKNKK